MKTLTIACFLAAMTLLAPSLQAEVTVGRTVPAAERVPLGEVDHSTWDALLKKYVDANGNLDYTGWNASAADQQALDQYLATLSSGSFAKTPTKKAQLAFWINAYNAVTVKGILREYPTTSIKNHTAQLVGYNIWHDLLLVVGSDQYSLDTIEHKILRKLGVPEIHFAIVCASHSCPKLRNEAYAPEKIEQQLVGNAQDFFSSPENFRYDAQSNTFYVSSILKWFAGDFGDDQTAQLGSIAKYLPSKAAQQAALSGKGSVKYLEYDWGLNDQKTAKK
jgi:hypothetical protein